MNLLTKITNAIEISRKNGGEVVDCRTYSDEATARALTAWCDTHNWTNHHMQWEDDNTITAWTDDMDDDSYSWRLRVR